MKPTKLTSKILKNLDPSDIIYAEFAEGGAMGATGTARIFTIEQNELKFYLVSTYGDEATEVDETTWAHTYKKLHDLAARGELQEENGGFGNIAWKQPGVTFSRDDDQSSFIYEQNGQTYQIPTSVAGVYDYIVAKFAQREIPLEELEKYLNSTSDNYTDEEYNFYHQYLDQCKRSDRGANWFDLTINDYLGAIAYIHHLDGTEYILNSDDRDDCRIALQKYRLRYVVEKIGWNELNKFFADFVSGHKTRLFKELEQLVKEPVDQIFTKIQTIKSGCTELDAISDHDIASLFTYQPVRVDFSAAAHAKIITKIQNLGPASLRSDAASIAFYLANYLLHEDEWPLADVLPAATYIVKNIPLDDFNDTHADQLLWVAGEIINDAWRFLEEKEEAQKKYRDLVYDSYWPRIGSLWPIQHYDQFEFKDKVTSKMFNDILSFVICLNDLTERNQEFKKYLQNYTPSKHYPHEMVRRKAFTESLKKLSSREQFNRIMAFESDIAWFYFAYPKSLDDAKILLNELFKKQNNKFTTISKFATLENLILTPNTIGVGEYILNYLDEHFEDLVVLVHAAEKEGMGLDFDPEIVLADLFVAMSKGISEENEFPAFKSLGDKLLRRGADETKIKSALAYARHRRRTILFQRSSLSL